MLVCEVKCVWHFADPTVFQKLTVSYGLVNESRPFKVL